MGMHHAKYFCRSRRGADLALKDTSEEHFTNPTPCSSPKSSSSERRTASATMTCAVPATPAALIGAAAAHEPPPLPSLMASARQPGRARGFPPVATAVPPAGTAFRRFEHGDPPPASGVLEPFAGRLARCLVSGEGVERLAGPGGLCHLQAGWCARQFMSRPRRRTPRAAGRRAARVSPPLSPGSTRGSCAP